MEESCTNLKQSGKQSLLHLCLLSKKGCAIERETDLENVLVQILCAQRTVRPNKPNHQSLDQSKVYCRATQEIGPRAPPRVWQSEVGGLGL